jgi:hypothetical protein
MKKLYTFLFIAISFSLFSQKAEISGTVTDERDNSPMIGVNVKIKGTTDGTSTDLDGAYTLKVPAGKPFALEYTYVGYQMRTIDFAGLGRWCRKNHQRKND